MRRLVLLLAAASSAANVKQLPLKGQTTEETWRAEETTYIPELATTYVPPATCSSQGGETTTRLWEDFTTEFLWTTTEYPTWPEEATTDDSWTEEPTTTEDYTTTTASGAGCPLGWIDDGKLGCFLFAPQMAGLSWIEALEYCEEQVHLLTLSSV